MIVHYCFYCDENIPSEDVTAYGIHNRKNGGCGHRVHSYEELTDDTDSGEQSK